MVPPADPERRRRLAGVVAAAALLGALVLTGRLLGTGDRTGAPAGGAAPATTAAGSPPSRPAGAVAVEGVALVPTGPGFRASCRRAAGRLGFAVPCPELLPVPASGPAPSRLCGENSTCRGELFWFSMEAFVVPPDSTGAPGSLGALSLLATRERAVAAGPGLWCAGQRQLAAPTLHGRPAVLATCPAGFQGWSADSVLLRWSEGGTFLTLALRGPSEHNQRLVVALADRLRLVRPG
jgi:hypothetical protein